MHIKNLLIQNFPLEPTGQQLMAFEELATFLASFDNQSCFILKGYAGTGKTTIIGALVKTLANLLKRSVLLAPTGRAAKVMSAYSGRKALTIHKKIYRKKSAASIQLDFTLAENMHENTLFIVDEASMLSDGSDVLFSKSVLADLISYVRSGQNCCLLFVGDTAQLPPVGLEKSPALDPLVLGDSYHLHPFYIELTDVVRQASDSGILYNATKIRKEIKLEEENQTYPIPKLITKPFKDVFRMTGEKLIEGLHYSYDKYGIENSMVICRSNKAANLYNQHIRNSILFREEEITGGDLIMVVRNNYFWLQQHDENNAGFIANGDMASVRKLGNEHEMHGFRFADITLDFLDGLELDGIQCRVLLDSLHVDSPNLPYEDQKRLYESILKDYEDIPGKKDRMEAIKKDPYYNALQIKFAYAITCHKAQGGQWESVFVDQGFLNDEMVNTEFLRWLYTSITRAKTELFLVNFSSHFY